MKKKPDEDEIKPRRQAMIGDNILAVAVEPGEKIFDVEGKFLGIVFNKHPVVNGQTIYLSNDDYDAARDALPKPKRIIH